MNTLHYCKCGKSPSDFSNNWKMEGSEFGMLDKIVYSKIEATCKICNESFLFQHGKNNDCW